MARVRPAHRGGDGRPVDRGTGYLSSRHCALNCYSDWPFAFDQIAISTGAIFAAYTSLSAGQELVLREPLGPERAAEVHLHPTSSGFPATAPYPCSRAS